MYKYKLHIRLKENYTSPEKRAKDMITMHNGYLSKNNSPYTYGERLYIGPHRP